MSDNQIDSLAILHKQELDHVDYISSLIDDSNLIFILTKYITKKNMYMMFMDHQRRNVKKIYDYKMIIAHLKIINKIGKDLLDEIVEIKKELVTLLEKNDRNSRYHKTVIQLRDILITNTIILVKYSDIFYGKLNKIIKDTIDTNYPDRHYVSKEQIDNQEIILLLDLYTRQIQTKTYVKSHL